MYIYRARCEVKEQSSRRRVSGGRWLEESGRCSYKRATLIMCCINIVVDVYVLRSIYASLYIYPLGGAHTSKNFVQLLIL